METRVAGPSVGQRQKVTSTDASVGPYRLCSSTLGSRSPKRATSSGGSASPLLITRFSSGAAPLSTSGCARNTARSDGTKWTVVTGSRWRTSSR